MSDEEKRKALREGIYIGIGLIAGYAIYRYGYTLSLFNSAFMGFVLVMVGYLVIAISSLLLTFLFLSFLDKPVFHNFILGGYFILMVFGFFSSSYVMPALAIGLAYWITALASIGLLYILIAGWIKKNDSIIFPL